MRCLVNLLRPADNKILKSEYLSADTYPLCEAKIKERNEKSKRKDNARWIINLINV